jgi:hypothetical protein
MRIVEDALSGFRTSTNISDGTARCDGIRFGPPAAASSYIAISQDGNDILLRHSSDLIRVIEAGLDDVANAVLGFTERLSVWASDLNVLIDSDAPLQALVDRSFEHFRNPIFIIDETNMVRARTDHALGSVNDDWDYIVQFNQMPIDRVRAIYNSNHIDWFSPSRLTKPFLYGPPGMTVRAINFRIPAADRSVFTGTLIIIENETPVTAGMLQYSSVLADAVVKWVIRHHGERLLYTVGDTLSDLLNGVKTSDDILGTLEHIISPAGNMYRIACAVSRDAMRISQYLHLIEDGVPGCMCCEQGDFLVMLLDDARKDDILRILDRLFLNIPVAIGVSYAFSDLRHCPGFLRQAKIAVRCGTRKISELNAESVMKYIAAEASATLSSSDLIHPAIRRLKNYDAKHGTQMYETLRVFLKNERSLTESLKKLNIHRNSLIYRLERIEKITECHFDDPDVRDWLLFSFRMVENE